jgi:hypothetical protein
MQRKGMIEAFITAMQAENVNTQCCTWILTLKEWWRSLQY